MSLPCQQRDRDKLWLVLSDFDETFWAHDPTLRDDDDVREFVELLDSSSAPLRFGLVTGSPISTVRDRISTLNPTVPLHFIAGDLGTELVVERDGELIDEPCWQAQLPSPVDYAGRVAEFIGEMRDATIDLIAQPASGHARFKTSFYLVASPADLDSSPHIKLLRASAIRAGLGLNVSYCNPKVGDPAGFLDVDVVPLGTGKSSVARHLQTLWEIPSQRTLAFGDSGNDIDMFDHAEHAWLVANATSEARRRHPRIARRAYLGGIIDTIRATLSEETK